MSPPGLPRTGKPDPPEHPGLTITEAAAATGVHRSTVRRYLDAGKLAGAYREDTPEGPGPWRIPVGDLIAAGLRPELPEPAVGSAGVGRRDVLGELEEWRRRAEVAEAVAAERERSLDDLRASLEALRDALRAVGAPAGIESPRRPSRRS